jgi:spermidine synthase
MSEYITEISESDANTSYPIRRRIWSGRTAACESVVIADSDTYGYMLFLDGELQSAEADERIYHESLVHPIMAGLPEGARVLVVGGGEGATVREVLKWRPSHVDWVDIDPELVALCAEHLDWAPDVLHDSRVVYRPQDIREFLGSAGLYDAIILDLPDPDGDTGYLYSPPFWVNMNSHLNVGGRLVTHVGPVRPFRGGGEGLQRVARESCGLFRPEGFYSICIPSFQGSWGFWLYVKSPTEAPFDFIDSFRDVGPLVADAGQMRAWATPSPIWRRLFNA